MASSQNAVLIISSVNGSCFLWLWKYFIHTHTHTHTLFLNLRHHEFEAWHTYCCLLVGILSDWMAAVRSCWLRICRKMSKHAQKSHITVWYTVLDKCIQSGYFLIRLPVYFKIILYTPVCLCSSQPCTDNFYLKITRYWHKMQTILVENMRWGCSYFIVKRPVIVIATDNTMICYHWNLPCSWRQQVLSEQW
jgi:hypothetical protein